MKLSLFADDMIVYIENPIDSTKKLLDLVSEFGKTEGYKVNIQHFCVSTMKHQKQKSRKKIPYDLATRKIKYLGINPTKDVKDLYSENCTAVKKEIKEDTNKWKCITFSWIR